MLIRAAHEVIEAIHKTEIGQTDLWRFIPTKTYRQLTRNEDAMAAIVSKYLKIKLDSMERDAKASETRVGEEIQRNSPSVTSCPLSVHDSSSPTVLSSSAASPLTLHSPLTASAHSPASVSPSSLASRDASSPAAAVAGASVAPSETILGQFFKGNSDASFGDILSTVLDLILAGIDTTAFSAGFVVYYTVLV